MCFKPNYRGLLICLISVLLICTGIIGLAFNINTYSLPRQEQTTLMDAAIESDINKWIPLTENHLEYQTRASNETFKPLPYIVVPEVEDGEIYKILPGEAYFDFKVYNRGNDEDNFETSAQVGQSDRERKQLEKKGWKAVVHSGRYTRILKPGEFQNVTVKVFVPVSVRAYSPCPIQLTATSLEDPEHVDGSKNKTFYMFSDLNKDASFLEDQLPPLYMFPDSERSTIFKIKNTGNSGDKTIRVNVTSKPEKWEVSLDLSDISVGGLPRNTTADIVVTIITPELVGVDVYNIKLAAISNKEIRDEIMLPVHILKVRKIELKCKEARKLGNVNEIITFTINVENKGNTQDTVDFSYSYLTKGMENLSWNIVFSENQIILDPFESCDVVVVVLIPPNALADTDFLTLNIQDGYLIEVKGISQNDTSVIADKELEVLVKPIYNFSFSKSKEVKYSILYHLQTLEYSLKIKNEGNTWDLVDIYYKRNYNWISIQYEQRRLLPYKTKELIIRLDPPPMLDLGQYNFTVYGRSVNNPSLVQIFELGLEIIDSDLELSKIQIGAMDLVEAEVKEGETVLIRALITNIGDLDYNNQTSDDGVVIKFMDGSSYLGDVEIPYLPSQRNSENNSIWVSLPWQVKYARSYTIWGKLDPYESFPETISKNNEFIGKLQVEEADDEIEDKKIDDDGENDYGIKTPNLPTIIVIILIFIIIIIMIKWLNILKTKRSLKKK